MLLPPCSDSRAYMGVYFNLHRIVTKRECNIATVKGLDPKACSSSTKAEVNERSLTPVVGFSRPQAASSSFVVPSAVLRAAFAAKQQSRMISTWGTAFSRRCCSDDHVNVELSGRLFLSEVSSKSLSHRHYGRNSIGDRARFMLTVQI